MIRRNGQTLTLCALTMLLVVLMGLMTASLASQVHRRMQLQTAADAAAWSNAVATARTLNALAVMNRVQVAHVVSTIGTLSLLSWATLYLDHAQNTWRLWAIQAAIMAAGGRDADCRRGRAGAAAAALLTYFHARDIERDLERDVVLYERDTRVRWEAALTLFDGQQQLLAQLRANLGGSQLAGQIARDAFGDSAVRALPAPGARGDVNLAELAGAVAPNLQRAGAEPFHAGNMVMGSRGHRFLYARDDTGEWRERLFTRSLPAGLLRIEEAFGRGFLDSGPDYSRANRGHPYGPFAHDRSGRTRTLLIAGAGCSTWPLALYIGWFRGRRAEADIGPNHHSGVHRVVHAQRTFPPFIDYVNTSLGDTANLYGQPKNVTVMRATPRAVRDPWELAFDFRFSARGTRLDLQHGSFAASPPAQIAVSAGVTSYARLEHFDEPPNLFAPYWHGGLTRLAVDRAADASRFDADVGQLVGAAGNPEAAAAYRALNLAGYRGFGQ